MAFDIKGARAAGYSESEILAHLATDRKFDLAGARKAGYADDELLQHLSQRQSAAVAAIPEAVPGANARVAAEAAAAPAPAADPTLIDKVIGTGETALTLATGATGGTLGMLGGTVKGLAGSVMDGTFGTQEGVRAVDKAAGEGMAALTYQPRTESGQQQASAVGEVMAAAIPAMPLTAELGAIGRGASVVAQGARDVGAASVQRIRTVAPAIAERVERTLRRNPVPEAATPGTKGGVGSAGTDMATMRVQSAENLPVPMRLTRGQATRDQDQIRFEVETAKGAQGGKIREFTAEQNELFHKNFDAMVDMTGAEVSALIDVGRAVDSAIVKKAARDKAEIRVAYKNADKAGEMEAPVTLAGLVDHLNDSAPDAATAPLLTTARGRAIQLGIAAEGPDGQLMPLPTTLKNAERYRQAVGRATDLEATNIRQSAIIKGEIDSATDSLGGAAYKAARRLRENYAKQYEDRAVVASLLSKKRGMADRKVALEDVFHETILKGSREDLSYVRRVLQTGDAEGKQAWRELQGATANWLKDEALKNVATDTRGNRIVSAAQLDRAVKQLEQGGKMDFIFGKQGAQMMRDLNDLAKVTMTTPPGAVNTSNTASVLLAALTEAGVTGSMTGLPVPVLSALRLVSMQVKDRRIQKRIEQALNHRAPSPPEPPRQPLPPRTLH